MLLGIDIGTAGTKAVLIGEKGKFRAKATAEYSLPTLKPKWAEQYPLEFKSSPEEDQKDRLSQARCTALCFSTAGTK